MKILSLPLRIILPSLVFILLSAYSILVMSLQYDANQQNYVAISEDQMRLLVGQRQRHIEAFLHEDDQAQIEQELNNLALVDEISTATLIDATGVIRFSTNKQWRDKTAEAILKGYSTKQNSQSVSTLQASTVVDDMQMRIYFPILFKPQISSVRADSVGMLYVERSLRDYLTAARNKLFTNIAISVAVALLIALLLAWLLSIVILSPLRQLRKGMEETQHSVEVKENGADEIIRLSRSYNVMQEKMSGALSALRNSEERWLFALDSSGDGVADWNMVADEVFFSRRLRYLLGYECEDYMGSYAEWKLLVHDDDKAQARKELKRYLAGETEVFQTEYRIHSGNDYYRWMFVRGKVVERLSDGTPTRFVATFSDFTERKNAEDALKSSEEEYRHLFELAQEGIWVVDEDSITSMVNKSMAKMLGYRCEEMVGKHMFEFMDDRGVKICEENFGKRKEKESDRLDFELTTKDGGRIYTTMSSSPIYIQGEYKGSIAGVVDITARIEAEDVIRRQANYDPLTDLPNRRMLFECLEVELERSRQHGYIGGVLFVDLDHFKNINDSLGHPVGDKLLMVIARRMRELVRSDDVVARLGGDEFVVMLPELDTDSKLAAELARNVAKKLQEVLSATFMIEGHQLNVSCSIGIALYPQDNDTIHDIFRQADAAMYRSKSDGRNAIRFFSQEMQEIAERRMQLQMLLPKALDNCQFFLQYQPQVDEKGELIGAEALVRWKQPTLGLVGPDQFVGVAEESGLIVALGDWILNEACTQLKEWQAMGVPAGFDRLAINISPRQFIMDDFAERVSAIVRKADVSPSKIELEITEGMLLTNLDAIVTKMLRLKEMGFLLSIDDFGTGYSSLSYLKSLPLSKLKIDQSFTRDIESDKNNRAIVETIISMAKHLGLDVLAEGVEKKQQLDFLEEKGCYKYQGYYFSKPLMPDQFYDTWMKPSAGSSAQDS